MVRGRCWLGLYHHPPESTSLSCDEWLPEYKFCKVGAGSSSRCGLTRSWANLTSQWAWLTHMLGNQLCKNTPPHCKLNCVKWCRTGQGFMGGSKWGEVGLSSAGKCRLVWGVEVARPCRNLLCWSVCQRPGFLAPIEVQIALKSIWKVYYSVGLPWISKAVLVCCTNAVIYNCNIIKGK